VGSVRALFNVGQDSWWRYSRCRIYTGSL